MIRKHWIVRYRPTETSESIREVAEELEPYGYESVLFTVHSRLGDMWTKISNSINKNHKFKYMIAFRPYLFSPQYLSMLTASFSNLSNNRLMLNLVHGIYGPGETFNGIIGGERLADETYRRLYSKEFMKKFLNDTNVHEKYQMPEILESGESDESIELAKESSNVIALFYESFIKDPERFTSKNFKKIFIFLSVLVGDTDEEVEKEISSIPEESRTTNGSPIYGSKETLTKKIQELERLGVTDILFSQFDQWHDTKQVHEFLEELTQDGILS
jgi:alkanesulfonate monooxygenase SsuD/methylene tetrahydromethanopterin reductase-like flavin-dependent oxidoreductase (luciferase family)